MILQCLPWNLKEEIETANDLKISKEQAGELLTVRLNGNLNIKTSPQLEAEFTNSLNGVKELILDFTNGEYISSAGLRVILGLEKNYAPSKRQDEYCGGTQQVD